MGALADRSWNRLKRSTFSDRLSAGGNALKCKTFTYGKVVSGGVNGFDLLSRDVIMGKETSLYKRCSSASLQRCSGKPLRLLKYCGLKGTPANRTNMI